MCDVPPCRIEETWRLWCKFLDDYSRFDDWLKMAERTAASPNSADVLYAVAKEELKKFEVSLEIRSKNELCCQSLISRDVLLMHFIFLLKTDRSQLKTIYK